MTKDEFIEMMKEKGLETNKLEKKSQSGKSGITKHMSQGNIKKMKNGSDEPDDEEGDDVAEFQINEEFKDVIRGVFVLLIQQQRAAAAERLRQEREKENEKKK